MSNTISAYIFSAVVFAVISVVCIPIITLLSSPSAIVHELVSTIRDDAACRAIIFINEVAIIACFWAAITKGFVVSADVKLAIIEAIVGFRLVPIITLFGAALTLVESDPISTDGVLAL